MSESEFPGDGAKDANEAPEVDAARKRLVDALLNHVPFDGWSKTAMAAAARECGMTAAEMDTLFPRGPIDAIEAFSSLCDQQMLEALEQEDLLQLRHRDRVARATRRRISLMRPHREAVRRGLAHLALPASGMAGPCCLYRTVDAIWIAVGDTSTDFNFYTKRVLLAGVYSATLLYWLNDDSDETGESWAFLDRRLADVMRIQSLRGRIEALTGRVPNPFDILGGILRPRS